MIKYLPYIISTGVPIAFGFADVLLLMSYSGIAPALGYLRGLDTGLVLVLEPFTNDLLIGLFADGL